MRGRPRTSLRLRPERGPYAAALPALPPERTYPGDSVLAEVELDFPGETPIDRVRLRLETTETQVPNPSRSSNVTSTTRWASEVTLAERGRMPKGPTVLRGRFPLPHDLPPSYDGRSFRVSHLFELRVEIPWWPDRRAHYELRVEPPPSLRGAPVARTFTTHRGGGEPFLEVALDETRLAPGDVLTGAIAIGNLRGKRCKGVRAALVGIERRPSGRVLFDWVAEGYAAHRFEFPFLDVPLDGKSGALRLRVPEAAPPFEALGLGVTWQLEVRAVMSWRSDVVLVAPIELVGLAGPQSAIARAFDVGEGRWRAAWAAVGATFGLGLDGASPLGLTGQLHGVGVTITPDPDHEVPALRAELRGFSLGLSLLVEKRTLSVLGALARDEGFSKRFAASARSAEQLAAALSPAARRALLAFDDARIEDEVAWARARTGNLEASSVEAFARRVDELARVIAHLEDSAAPPESLAPHVDAWQAFARRVEGRLVRGSLSVRGARVEGARLALERVFERERPSHVRVTLELEPPLEPGERFDRSLEQKAVLAARAELEAEARSLELSPARLCLETKDEHAGPEGLDALLARMLGLARHLRGTSGPYR